MLIGLHVFLTSVKLLAHVGSRKWKESPNQKRNLAYFAEYYYSGVIQLIVGNCWLLFRGVSNILLKDLQQWKSHMCLLDVPTSVLAFRWNYRRNRTELMKSTQSPHVALYIFSNFLSSFISICQFMSWPKCAEGMKLRYKKLLLWWKFFDYKTTWQH